MNNLLIILLLAFILLLLSCRNKENLVGRYLKVGPSGILQGEDLESRLTNVMSVNTEYKTPDDQVFTFSRLATQGELDRRAGGKEKYTADVLELWAEAAGPSVQEYNQMILELPGHWDLMSNSQKENWYINGTYTVPSI